MVVVNGDFSNTTVGGNTPGTDDSDWQQVIVTGTPENIAPGDATTYSVHAKIATKAEALGYTWLTVGTGWGATIKPADIGGAHGGIAQMAGTQTGSRNRTIVQFIENTAGDSGDFELKFDVDFTDGSATDTKNVARVWGITDGGNGDWSFSTELNLQAKPDQTVALNADDGDSITVLATFNETAGTSGWESKSLPFSTGTTVYDCIAVAFGLDSFNAGGSNNDSWQLDNVSIIPEPATLALASVGLLGLRRKRRSRAVRIGYRSD